MSKDYRKLEQMRIRKIDITEAKKEYSEKDVDTIFEVVKKIKNL